MELRLALTTTGAVREFSNEPVDTATVRRILDTARFAPSGGNRQAWRAILVQDADTKRRLRDLYLTGWYEYLSMGDAEAEAISHAGDMRPAANAGGFAEHLDQAPVLIVLLADLRALAAVDRDHDRYTLVGGASIYPFAWSILLAAHDEGLGGVITTMLCREEEGVLDLLGVPEGWALAAGIVLGRPAGRRPTKLRRAAVDDFAAVDRFDGRSL
jgi:nitroreductase